MKTTIKSLFILSVIFCLTSCLKENHSIRLKNDYIYQINNVVIGSADIGSVGAGTTSEYSSINTGDFKVSGTTSAGQQLSGSGSISGNGKHKWTMTVSSSGTISFSEDK